MDTWRVIDYVQAGMLARHKDYRAGQALFNAIHLVRPDLANKIRATGLDPFYNNDRIGECATWLKSMLESEK